MNAKQNKHLIITIGKPEIKPWWWDEIKLDPLLCKLDYRRVVFKNKTSQQIKTSELFFLLIKFLPIVLNIRKKYDFVFTFECSLTSFIIAFWQTVLLIKKPKHVILQFIMREKTQNIKSRIKYAIMKFIFSSVYKIICSSKNEVNYYVDTFQWRRDKAFFIPMHTDPNLLSLQTSEKNNYVFAAGRTFRDYETFVKSISNTTYQAIIVSGKETLKLPDKIKNIRLLSDIPLKYFNELLANSKIVVIPLHDLNISTGQMVVLQSMAMGKAIIATRTTGTVDYIENYKTGILVEPYNPDDLKHAIELLINDSELRLRLGAAAKQAVRKRHLPHHYRENICNFLQKIQ
jgi:glycosyltransferase involved in cell wall biosynthesis